MTLRPRIPATITLAEVGRQRWDVVVLGAGPAGVMAARECARSGYRVLLADRATFPRDKVCGCCLNGAALHTLTLAGLGDLPTTLHAQPLSTLDLSNGRRRVSLPLTTGVSLSRSSLDAELITRAVQAGVEFIDGVIGKVEQTHPSPLILLRAGLEQQSLHPRCAVMATGLGARGTEELPGRSKKTRHNSLVGLGTVVETKHSSFAPGTIYMATGLGGYVGLVRLEDNRLDIAAAMSKSHLKRYGETSEAVGALLAECQLPVIDELLEARWRGTPRLTQRLRRLQYDTIFITGDAAGYVEPFTGEGIGWALASGLALAPHLVRQLDAAKAPPNPSWEKTYRQLVGRRQRRCRWIARGLRSPRLVRLAIGWLEGHPSLADRMQRHLNDPLLGSQAWKHLPAVSGSTSLQ